MSGPHDLFVRYTFGHPERAAAELRAALPPHLVSSVDWDSLRPESGSVVDDDLTAEREEALRTRPGPPLVRLAWRVLRYGRTGELAHRLPDWTVLFAQVRAAPDGDENLRMVVRYLLYTGDSAAHRVTRQVLHSVMDAQRAEELMRSWGERLIERGIRRGLAQGRAEGRAEDVLRILDARGLHVTDEARQRILSCTDISTLDRWFNRALRASTLANVLGDLTQ
ncbi:MAG TPA: Rpn family recombination-promoting nuclease/putative transposase [Archangium sp.]|nr:Rpn family recombination-promoting nuclease/putative transposase [Archangium sp.]